MTEAIVDESLTSSDSSTASCCRWARNLQYVLDDLDGYHLFTQFLNFEAGNSNELTFWYACKGFKEQYMVHVEKSYEAFTEKQDKEKSLKGLSQHILRDYMNDGGRTVLPTLRPLYDQVKDNINKWTAPELIFDDAQKRIEADLTARHAQFVQSDLYLTYVQKMSRPNPDESTDACILDNITDPIAEELRQEKTLKNLDDDDQDDNAQSILNFNQFCHANEFSLSTTSCNLTDVDSPMTSSMVRHLRPIMTTSLALDDSAMSSSMSGVLPGSGTATSSSVNPSYCTLPHNASSRRKFHDGATIQPSTLSNFASTLKLTSHSLVDSLRDRRHCALVPHNTTPGIPPNPYHSSRPYQPYCTTSTQDSEFSGANADSSNNGSAFTTNAERNARRIARRNVDMEVRIPRLTICEDVQCRTNMMDDDFNRKVLHKLHVYVGVRKEDDSLRQITNESSANYRQTVREFPRNVKAQAVATSKLPLADEHFNNHFRHVGWEITPKRSPLLSPGGGIQLLASNAQQQQLAAPPAVPQRRRSPQAQKPTISRMMTTSINGVPTIPAPSAVIQHQSTVTAAFPHHFNTQRQTGVINGHNNACLYPNDGVRPSTSQPPFNTAMGLISSNPISSLFSKDEDHISSSGVFSGGSTNPSAFSSTMCSRTKLKTPYYNMPQRNKDLCASKINTTSVQNFAKRSSTGKSPATGPSNAKNGLAASNVGNSCQDSITVVYFLPHEPTPFRTRVSKREMTLSDFKEMLRRKASLYRYYFKSKAPDVGEVWEELIDDTDVIPFHKPYEITARVESAE